MPSPRTYGRVFDELGNYVWVEIGPDAATGQLDEIYITTLIQCLRLSLGEDPFFAQYGIPAQQSVVQQVYPDFYVNRTQAQFAQYFASLLVWRENTIVPPNQRPVPTYRVSVVTHQGVVYPTFSVPNVPPI